MLFKPSSNLTADLQNLKREFVIILFLAAEILEFLPSNSKSANNDEEEGGETEGGLLTGLLLLDLARLVTTAAEGDPHDETIGRSQRKFKVQKQFLT